MPNASRIAWLVFVSVLATLTLGCVYGRVAFSPDGTRMAAVVIGERPPEDEAEPRGKPLMELWVTDLAEGGHTLVARDRLVGGSPAWSPTGGTLWFLQGEEPDEMQLMRWDGGPPTPVAAVSLHGDLQAVAIFPPQPTPDGSSVVFTTSWDAKASRVAAGERTTSVVRLDLADRRTVVLATPAAGASLSPSGDLVAYFAWRAGRQSEATLCVCRVDGTGAPRVVAKLRDKLSDIAFSPITWSRDGRFVAWTDEPESAQRVDDHAIHVADVIEGSPARCVSTVETPHAFPLWSADGKTLYIGAHLAGDTGWHVRAVSVTDGTTEVVPGSDGCIPAGLSPDGRTLALRLALPSKGVSVRDGSVVRLVDLETGTARDDWVTPAQRIWFADEMLRRADHHLAESVRSVRAAEAALAAVDTESPEAEALRRRLARWHATGILEQADTEQEATPAPEDDE